MDLTDIFDFFDLVNWDLTNQAFRNISKLKILSTWNAVPGIFENLCLNRNAFLHVPPLISALQLAKPNQRINVSIRGSRGSGFRGFLPIPKAI